MPSSPTLQAKLKVDDAWGLALLFRQFDDKKSARDSKDICGAYQGLFEPLHAVPKDSAKLAVEGVSWFRGFIYNPEGMPVLKGRRCRDSLRRDALA